MNTSIMSRAAGPAAAQPSPLGLPNPQSSQSSYRDFLRSDQSQQQEMGPNSPRGTVAPGAGAPWDPTRPKTPTSSFANSASMTSSVHGVLGGPFQNSMRGGPFQRNPSTTAELTLGVAQHPPQQSLGYPYVTAPSTTYASAGGGYAAAANFNGGGYDPNRTPRGPAAVEELDEEQYVRKPPNKSFFEKLTGLFRKSNKSRSTSSYDHSQRSGPLRKSYSQHGTSTSNSPAGAGDGLRSEPSLSGGGGRKPRSLRFTFKLRMTTQMETAALLAELQRSLEAHNCWYIPEKPDNPYKLLCQFLNPNVVDGRGDCRWQMEIVRLPRLKLNGLRFKRLDGFESAYRDILTKVLNHLHL